jgi:hypothetical protein
MYSSSNEIQLKLSTTKPHVDNSSTKQHEDKYYTDATKIEYIEFNLI